MPCNDEIIRKPIKLLYAIEVVKFPIILLILRLLILFISKNWIFGCLLLI